MSSMLVHVRSALLRNKKNLLSSAIYAAVAVAATYALICHFNGTPSVALHRILGDHPQFGTANHTPQTPEDAIAMAWAKILVRGRFVRRDELNWIKAVSKDGKASSVAAFFAPPARLFDADIRGGLGTIENTTLAVIESGRMAEPQVTDALQRQARHIVELSLPTPMVQTLDLDVETSPSNAELENAEES